MAELEGKPKPEEIATRRTLFKRVVIVLIFIALVTVGVQGWEWSNSTAFCTTVCHDVHLEESVVYQDSYHVRVGCIECHIKQESTLRSIVLKSSHMKHLPAVLLGRYNQPLEANTLRPTRESCEHCHWPSAFHGDRVLGIRRFQADEHNTEKRTYLVLRTGGGERERGLGYGIHWHIENQIEYIATDEQEQDIRWVRATLPDGQVVEYNDVTNPLSGEEIAKADKQVMDCVDCHNRMGHPFLSPDRTIDKALADGRLDHDLPFIKQEMMDLFTTAYSDQETALAAAELMETRYRSTYPEAVSTRAAAIKQATEVAQELSALLMFEAPGVTWLSFPNNIGHDEFPGCFRCHDGKHQSPDGESIRLHCNICHSIPMVVDAESRSPAVPLSSIQEPMSHLEANFIANHRFQASDDCTVCHGEIAFGNDDSSFCANSACHGQAWPSVDLAAAFPHPTPLVGKHAEAGCYDCHAGVEKLSSQCATCHQPPNESHFGSECENCHTPDGFAAGTRSESMELPMQLEGAHAELECSACHVPSQGLEVKCANCHQPPSGPPFGPNHLGQDCENCHELTGFEGATLPPERHPVLLVGNHQRVSCDGCHTESAPVLEYVCTNCHQPPESHLEVREMCNICHTPEGFVESAASIIAQMPHPLDEREVCLVCHAEGGLKPVPATHQDRANETCLRCHQITGTLITAPGIPHDTEGRDDCLVCHAEGGSKPVPADHQGRVPGDCWLCHEPATGPAAGPPSVPHTLEGRDDCLVCHAEGGIKPVPSDHQDRASETCLQCHQTGDAPAALPGIPHDIEGRDDCLACHAEGGMKPVPSDHQDRASETCLQCHQPAGDPAAAVPGIPHDMEGRDDCLACHAEGGLKPVPADHQDRASEDCLQCHEASASDSENPPAGEPLDIPHTLDGRDDCLACHVIGGLNPVPADHQDRSNEYCLLCHQPPAGTAAPPPSIPHTLDERDECLVCHDRGGLKSVPADHQGRNNPDCQLCHEPTDEPTASVPGIPHTLDGRDDCLICHAEGGLKPAPADHQDRSNEYCLLCHQPSAGAAASPPNIPHTLEGRDDCLLCHAEGGLKPVPADHEGRASGDCQMCHQAAAEPAAPSPSIPHELEGRDDCLLCHDPSGEIEPAPIDHTDRTTEQCVLCHQSES